MQFPEDFINRVVYMNALDGLKLLPDKSVNCFVSSPPYWALRSYLPETDPNKKYELGQEPTFKQYLDNLLEIFKEIHRVLRDDGCCFVNLGDTHYGGGKGDGGSSQLKERKQRTNDGSIDFVSGKQFKHKETKDKSLCNIPYRFAIRMTDEIGWIHRNLIIWHKPNKFPESCKDRFTVDFEPIFFFTKNKKYDFRQQFEPYSTKYNYNETYTGDATKDYESNLAQNPSDAKRRILESIKDGKGRNKRSVWSINVKPSKSKHTATFNNDLIKPLILAGCPEGGIVLDVFAGTNTTGLTAKELGRNFISFDIDKDFCNV